MQWQNDTLAEKKTNKNCNDRKYNELVANLRRVVGSCAAADWQTWYRRIIGDRIGAGGRIIRRIVDHIRWLLLVRIHRTLIVRTVCVRGSLIVGASCYLCVGVIRVAVALWRRLLVHIGRLGVVRLVGCSTGIAVVRHRRCIHGRLTGEMIAFGQLFEGCGTMEMNIEYVR